MSFKDLDEYIDIFECVIKHHSATYVSVPITTGMRFLEWYNEKGRFLDSIQYKEKHIVDVFQPNVIVAQDFIEKLRQQEKKIVIEPTSLDIEHWSQADYHYFWKSVIERYVNKVYFLDGWNYSRGCVMEYATSLKKGIAIYSQDFQSLPPEEGVYLIGNAIKEYKAVGLDSTFHQNILTEIESLGSALLNS